MTIASPKTRRLGATLALALLVLAVPAALLKAQNASPAPAADAGDPTQSPAIELAGTKPPNLERGKQVFLTVAVCADCHGWPGDGKTGREPHSEGDAANLRESALDTNDMIRIVSCGIPGTAMPYHDRAAYKADTRCYGTKMADYPADQAPVAGNSIGKQDIINVVAYVQQKIRGRGPLTKAECEEIFTPGSPSCAFLDK